MRWIIVASAVMLLGGSAQADDWMVNPEVANIRSGPSTDYEVVTQLRRGDIVDPIEYQDPWWQVRTSSGDVGWIRVDLIDRYDADDGLFDFDPRRSGMTDGELLGLTIVLLGIVGVYFLPTLVAWLRGHQYRCPIFVLNLFLGGTGVGWVVAMAMAVSPVKKTPSRRLTLHDAEPPLRTS